MIPLAEADARFLKAKVSKVFELPPGLKLHYSPYLIQPLWRDWVMRDRKEVGDIRQIAARDNDAVEDVWTWDLIVRFVLDGQQESSKGERDG